MSHKGNSALDISSLSRARVFLDNASTISQKNMHDDVKKIMTNPGINGGELQLLDAAMKMENFRILTYDKKFVKALAKDS
jgi:hypothetical protein